MRIMRKTLTCTDSGHISHNTRNTEQTLKKTNKVFKKD